LFIWSAGYVNKFHNQLISAIEGEAAMKDSTKDEVKGSIHEVKGKVKEQVGRVTKNPDLEAEGQGEKVGGKILKKIGQVEKVLGS
jgi:uncharacterized protein YjbJ (UPF0337 family)